MALIMLAQSYDRMCECEILKRREQSGRLAKGVKVKETDDCLMAETIVVKQKVYHI